MPSTLPPIARAGFPRVFHEHLGQEQSWSGVFVFNKVSLQGHQAELTSNSENGAKLLSLRIRAMSYPDNPAWEGDLSLKSGTA